MLAFWVESLRHETLTLLVVCLPLEKSGCRIELVQDGCGVCADAEDVDEDDESESALSSVKLAVVHVLATARASCKCP